MFIYENTLNRSLTLLRNMQVLQSELVGKRIVLTENKLKLGKQKYKVTYNDVDRVSCVFGTGKSLKPYKTGMQ